MLACTVGVMKICLFDGNSNCPDLWPLLIIFQPTYCKMTERIEDTHIWHESSDVSERSTVLAETTPTQLVVLLL
jgi:hypothetical protein